MKHTILALVLSSVCSLALAQSPSLPNVPAAKPLPPLVGVSWLKAHAAQVQIVDVRDDVNTLTDDPVVRAIDGKKTLEKVGGYIPGSLSVNFWALRTKDFRLPSPRDFQAVMQASQVMNGKPIVIVPTGDDATSLQEAALFAYELVYYGEPQNQVSILNGGVHAWIAAGGDVDEDAIAPMSSGNWTRKPLDAGVRAVAWQVQHAAQDRATLVDARPTGQFDGLSASPAVGHPGRIAAAVSLPPSLLYARDPRDGSWRFVAERQDQASLAKALGGSWATRPAIVYCNTGQFAAGAWYTMARIDGDHSVQAYPDGLHAWSELGLPLVVR